MQYHLRLGRFQPKKENLLSIVLVQSVLDEQPLFNVSLLNMIHVFVFRNPPKYENPFHFLLTTNPSDQYNNQNINCLNYNSTIKWTFMPLDMSAGARIVHKQ